MGDAAIRDYLEDHLGAYLAELTALAEHESPSRDKPRLDALAATIAARWASLGAVVELVANPDGGEHVVARFGRAIGQRPSLILGHFDTVWPAGTLDRMPVRSSPIPNRRRYGCSADVSFMVICRRRRQGSRCRRARALGSAIREEHSPSGTAPHRCPWPTNGVRARAGRPR